jgi:hypothetical protein
MHGARSADARDAQDTSDTDPSTHEEPARSAAAARPLRSRVEWAVPRHGATPDCQVAWQCRKTIEPLRSRALQGCEGSDLREALQAAPEQPDHRRVAGGRELVVHRLHTRLPGARDATADATRVRPLELHRGASWLLWAKRGSTTSSADQDPVQCRALVTSLDISIRHLGVPCARVAAVTGLPRPGLLARCRDAQVV